MPKNPQNWPFSNWTKLGLGKDTPCDTSILALILLN
ncbi:hypothetical protein F383_37868 [Gossypium arboreum]|uniref:Uncharacterized protein n=1 Tax=Gossypium arboreum TaxID=29729 RepID=A0A0B0MGT9_GOSAR|nr:hypothetical protein F383_37868 [Gossypium arboreum]